MAAAFPANLDTRTKMTAHQSSYVRQTRRYGSCYVKVGDRPDFGTIDGITYSYTSWGRSLQNGGHKYKAYANYADTGKPVPTKLLSR